jgi:hypothetical protein
MVSTHAPDSLLDAHFSELELRHTVEELQEHVLWPRTPIDADEMQRIIGLRVGASDREPAHPRSRPARVAAATRALRASGVLPGRPSVVDIACGDALVLIEVKRRCPLADCYGLDLNIGAFPSHETARESGIALHRVLIQDLFTARTPVQVDLAVMLNTYRGWESADLRDSERDLPRQADAWFDDAARCVLMTMRNDQLPAWRERGYATLDLGSGEDASRMVLLLRDPVPAGLRQAVAWIRLRSRLARARHS